VDDQEEGTTLNSIMMKGLTTGILFAGATISLWLLNSINIISLNTLFVIPVLIVSLTAHEYAHAWTAKRFGDTTAEKAGRLTLNPLAHISLIGTILMPILVKFGWAKPVPVNFDHLSPQQTAVVAASGPAANLAIAAVLGSVFLVSGVQASAILGILLLMAVKYNLILAVFNMIPVSPLDGQKVLFPLIQKTRVLANGSIAGYVTGAILALLGLPVMMMICDRMYYADELQKGIDIDQVTSEEIAEQIAADIETKINDMGEMLDELADAIESEGEDELDSEIDDEEKHDIRDITIRSVVRHLKSGKKDKNFAELLGTITAALHRKVLTEDTLQAIKGVMDRDGVRDILQKIYDTTEEDLGPDDDNGGGGPTKKAASGHAQEILKVHLKNLAQRLGGGHHHHHGGHSHLIWIGFTLTFSYILNSLCGGAPIDWLLYGLMAATIANGANPQGEEESGDIIAEFTNDLDELARQKKIDDTYYFSSGVAVLNSQVTNDDINNLMVIGDPTATQGFIEAAVVRKKELGNLKKAKFLEINTARFIEGLSMPGQLEVTLRKLNTAIKAAYKNKRVVLVLNFQDYYDLSQMKGGMASLYFQLKEALEAKNISLVLLANPQLYEAQVSKDKKLSARSEIIDLRTPQEYDLELIARKYARNINSLYRNILPEGIKVIVPRKVIKEGLALSQKYYSQGLSVNKLQEVIDKIIVNKFTSREKLQAHIKETEEMLLKASEKLQEAVAQKKDKQEIAFLEKTLDDLLTKRAVLKKELEEYNSFLKELGKIKKWKITIEDIARQISVDSGIPLFEILAEEDELLKQYRPRLKEMLIGQDKVIDETYNAFRRRREIGTEGKKGSKQPIGNYLLVGPTGVGKTEFARSLARHMFGSEDALVRIDMSEYMSPSSDQKLIGPPPGYVGYEEGGQLTNHILKRPYSVVLLDEIEKAHSDVHKLLLQVFEEGELRDGKGRVAKFGNTIILMTSNIGFSEACHAEKREKTDLDSMIKVKKAQLEDIRTKASNETIKKELEELAIRLGGLKKELSTRSIEDRKLSGALKYISQLLSDDDSPSIAKDRKEFLVNYTQKRIETLEKARETDIERVYQIIAKLKDVTTEDTETNEKLKEEILSIATTEKDFLQILIENMSGDTGSSSIAPLEKYCSLCQIIAADSSSKIAKGLVEYLRSGVRKKILDSIKLAFRPELLNRIGLGNIIYFDPLSKKNLNSILNIKLKKINGLLKEQGLGKLLLSETVREKVLEEGFDVKNGARPLERSLKKLVLAPLSEYILSGSTEKGKDILALMAEDKSRVTFMNNETTEDIKVITHLEIIEKIKNSDPSLLDTLRELLDLEEEVTMEVDLEEAREKFEIDLAEPVELPEMQLKNDEIKERLVAIKSQIGNMDTQIEELKAQLIAVNDDSQRQALTQELVNRNMEKELLKKRQTILEKRLEGKEDDAKALQKELVAKMQTEEEEARREINQTFENLTLDSLEDLARDIHPPFEAVEQLASILKQQKRNFPLILEESPLTQKAVVDSFADRITRGKMDGFDNTRVLRLKLETLKEYFSMVGYFETRMKEIVEIIEADDKRKGLKTIIVVDFDDIKEELVRVRINPFILGYFLRMFKGLETISFVMTTSRQAITEDDSFHTHLSLIEIPEQDKRKILVNLYLFVKDFIEKKVNGNGNKDVKIEFDAMQVSVKLWEHYFSADSAVETFQRWFSGLLIKKREGQSHTSIELQDFLSQLVDELQDTAESEETSLEDMLEIEEITKLVRKINLIKEEGPSDVELEVGAEELLDHVCEIEATRGIVEIDEDMFKTDEKEGLLNLEEKLASRVIYQDKAIAAVSSAVRIAKAGLKPPQAPLGTFIFAGPTGVGKTQLAKTLSSTLGMKSLRIDMSEYKDRSDLQRLIGAPPGYVGYDEGEGFLFQHMRRYPKSVIIFDEIDKANPQIMNILLQVMEDGRLTSNRGNTVSFSESVIILTTNLGMKQKIEVDGKPRIVSLYKEMEEVVRSGDKKKVEKFQEKMSKSIDEASRNFFRPEFLNRIDSIQVFNPLPLDSLVEIVEIFIKETVESFGKRKKLNLVIGKDSEEKLQLFRRLADLGYNPEYGARPMKEAIERYFENELIEFLEKCGDSISQGDTIVAGIKGKTITFTHDPKEDEDKEEIPAADQEILEKIAARFGEKPNEPLSLFELEEIFGFRKEVDLDSGEMLEISGSSKSVGTHNFFKKDSTVKDITSWVDLVIPESIKPVEDESPSEASQKMTTSLKKWIKEVVRVAKMANVEAYMYETDKSVVKDYFNLGKPNLKEEVAAYMENAGAEKTIEVKMECKDGDLKIGIIFSSGLTRFLQNALFVEEYADRDEVEKNAPRSLQGLLKVLLDINALGAKTGYFLEKGSTCLWLNVKIEEETKIEPYAIAAASKGISGEEIESIEKLINAIVDGGETTIPEEMTERYTVGMDTDKKIFIMDTEKDGSFDLTGAGLSNPQFQQKKERFERFVSLYFEIIFLIEKEKSSPIEFKLLLDRMGEMVRLYLNIHKNQPLEQDIGVAAGQGKTALAGGQSVAEMFLRLKNSFKLVTEAVDNYADSLGTSPETFYAQMNETLRLYDKNKTDQHLKTGAESYSQGQRDAMKFRELLEIVYKKGFNNLPYNQKVEVKAQKGKLYILNPEDKSIQLYEGAKDLTVIPFADVLKKRLSLNLPGSIVSDVLLPSGQMTLKDLLYLIMNPIWLSEKQPEPEKQILDQMVKNIEPYNQQEEKTPDSEYSGIEGILKVETIPSSKPDNQPQPKAKYPAKKIPVTQIVLLQLKGLKYGSLQTDFGPNLKDRFSISYDNKGNIYIRDDKSTTSASESTWGIIWPANPSTQLKEIQPRLERFINLYFEIDKIIKKDAITRGDGDRLFELMEEMVKLYLHLFKDRPFDEDINVAATWANDLVGGRSVAQIFTRLQNSLLEPVSDLTMFGPNPNLLPLPFAMQEQFKSYNASRVSSEYLATGAENYSQAQRSTVTFRELLEIIYKKGFNNLSSKIGLQQAQQITVSETQKSIQQKASKIYKTNNAGYDLEKSSGEQALKWMSLEELFKKKQQILNNDKMSEMLKNVATGEMSLYSIIRTIITAPLPKTSTPGSKVPNKTPKQWVELFIKPSDDIKEAARILTLLNIPGKQEEARDKASRFEDRFQVGVAEDGTIYITDKEKYLFNTEQLAPGTMEKIARLHKLADLHLKIKTIITQDIIALKDFIEVTEMADEMVRLYINIFKGRPLEKSIDEIASEKKPSGTRELAKLFLGIEKGLFQSYGLESLLGDNTDKTLIGEVFPAMTDPIDPELLQMQVKNEVEIEAMVKRPFKSYSGTDKVNCQFRELLDILFKKTLQQLSNTPITPTKGATYVMNPQSQDLEISSDELLMSGLNDLYYLAKKNFTRLLKSSKIFYELSELIKVLIKVEYDPEPTMTFSEMNFSNSEQQPKPPQKKEGTGIDLNMTLPPGMTVPLTPPEVEKTFDPSLTVNFSQLPKKEAAPGSAEALYANLSFQPLKASKGAFVGIKDSAVDAEGNIFICNEKKGSVFVLNPDGKGLNQAFGRKGVISKKVGLFDKPRAISIDKNGNIFVANSGNDTISVLNPDGKGLNENFGDNGIIKKETGLFDGVQKIAFDKWGQIFVVNFKSSTISVLTPDGKNLSEKMGRNGIITQKMGKFNRPISLALDNNGNIFVVNTSGNNISVLLPMGKRSNSEVGEDGIISQAAAALDFPTDIAIDENGFILITSFSKDYISILDPYGTNVFVKKLDNVKNIISINTGKNGALMAISSDGTLTIISKESKSGAIGNGKPLTRFTRGILPKDVITGQEEYEALLNKVEEAMTIAEELYSENVGSIPVDYIERGEQIMGLLKLFKKDLRSTLYLFDAVIEGPEDYLLGFNVWDLLGLDIGLINKLYEISPKRLAQYIFHECAIEEDVEGRVDHKGLYTVLQKAVFGEAEVISLGKDLRDRITSHLEDTDLEALIKNRFIPASTSILSKIGNALDSKKKAQSLILYADDIVRNAVLYDLETTLKLIKKTGVLKDGKIVMYSKDEALYEKVEGLKVLIENAVGPNTEVIVIKQWGNKAQLTGIDDPLKETQKLVRLSSARGAKNVMAIIRGNGLDWIDAYKEYDLKIPLVIMNDNVKGVFSFAEALQKAIKIKEYIEISSGTDASKWIICLDPIEALTEKMYEEYITYRNEILIKA